MSPKSVLALLGMLGLAVNAGADGPVPAPVLPESLEWYSPPGNPGIRATWVVGAEREPGLYALRVRLAAGAKIAPHTHPDTRYSTVLSGTLYVGFGTAVNESAIIAVPAGAVYVAPANQPHYLWARDGEVVYQESGDGPTGTVAVSGQQG
jgi:quercetin dioxygenase-like cupin family protein